MTSPSTSVPSHGSSAIRTIEINTKLYGRDALFQTCYKFTDRCYLFLRQVDPDVVEVEFTARTNSADLGQITGEFANELIDQRLRADIARETRTIREAIVTQAFTEGGFIAV
jgi:His-Xaa-Ser system protein HxsD